MLTFVWKIRDHSLLRLIGLTLLLMLFLGAFFVVFRITYPAVQQADAVPQRVLILDPSDPESLAIIHRAQDKSFGLVPAEPVDGAGKRYFPSFTPSFAGAELRLRRMVAAPEVTRHPRIFTPLTSVLPAVPRRATLPQQSLPQAVLQAVPSPEVARRAPSVLSMPGVELTDPENARFSIAIAASGQVVQALPLFTSEVPAVTSRLLVGLRSLKFQPDLQKPLQWGTVSFRWQTTR